MVRGHSLTTIDMVYTGDTAGYLGDAKAKLKLSYEESIENCVRLYFVVHGVGGRLERC